MGQSIESITLDNNIITDSLKMASTFNECFAQIGPNLVNNIQAKHAP